jgi:hypothetical protein
MQSGEDYITRIFMICTAHQILFELSNQENRWVGRVARMGVQEKSIQDFNGGPEGRRLVGRPRRRWEDITMDLNEVGTGNGLD